MQYSVKEIVSPTAQKRVEKLSLAKGTLVQPSLACITPPFLDECALRLPFARVGSEPGVVCDENRLRETPPSMPHRDFFCGSISGIGRSSTLQV